MNVNKDVFEAEWEQIRAQTKVWWSLFSEEDLKKVEKASIKLDKYTVMLRMKYGYTHERAREEINKRVTELEVNPLSSESKGDSRDRQVSIEASKARKIRTTKSSP